jgi:hypothetical protein
MFLLHCNRPRFTPIQNNRQNCSFVYFKINIFLENGRQEILHRMRANNLWLQHALLKLTTLREFILLPSLGEKLEYWVWWNLSFIWLPEYKLWSSSWWPHAVSSRWLLFYHRNSLPTSVSYAENVEKCYDLGCWLTASHLGVHEFVTDLVHVGIMVDKVALGQIFFRVLPILSAIVLQPKLHIHIIFFYCSSCVTLATDSVFK